MKAYRSRLVIALMAVSLIVAACSSTTDSNEVADTTMADDMDMEGAGEFSFGSPMEGGDVDHVIEITAMDDFSFSPKNVAVQSGEVVTFRVTNAGAIPHDFVLGTEEMQDEHEAEMAEMSGDMDMHSEPNVFSLEPGETKELTWHFTDSGSIIFGCHQPGHYAAGMKGSVLIGS